jgi:excisionase family DNA binding protein
MALTTSEAARRLQVTPREVRRLIAAGDLVAESAGRFFLVDEASVAARVRVPVLAGRALAEGTAWAGLLEASGERAGWLDAPTRSRLRSWLRGRDVEHIAAACRRRAVRHELRVLPAYATIVATDPDVVAAGMRAAADVGADIVSLAESLTEVYCSASTLDRLNETFQLTDTRPATSTAGGTGVVRSGAVPANLIVRVPSFTDPQVLARSVMPAAVVAVDLSEAANLRTRRAGLDLLAATIQAHLA